jgi:ribosomal protein L37AE/L43A
MKGGPQSAPLPLSPRLRGATTILWCAGCGAIADGGALRVINEAQRAVKKATMPKKR